MFLLGVVNIAYSNSCLYLSFFLCPHNIIMHLTVVII